MTTVTKTALCTWRDTQGRKCPQATAKRGLCNAHYIRWRRSPAFQRKWAHRFWSKVYALPNGCWEWRGATNGRYGHVWFLGKHVFAHRLSYRIWIGPLEPSLQLDHLCRNTLCINPTHLEQVTQQTNTLRGRAGDQERTKTHCRQGHPYDLLNTIWKANPRNGRPMRLCRECRRGRHDAAYWREYRQKRKATAA